MTMLRVNASARYTCPSQPNTKGKKLNPTHFPSNTADVRSAKVCPLSIAKLLEDRSSSPFISMAPPAISSARSNMKAKTAKTQTMPLANPPTAAPPKMKVMLTERLT